MKLISAIKNIFNQKMQWKKVVTCIAVEKDVYSYHMNEYHITEMSKQIKKTYLTDNYKYTISIEYKKEKRIPHFSMKKPFSLQNIDNG